MKNNILLVVFLCFFSVLGVLGSTVFADAGKMILIIKGNSMLNYQTLEMQQEEISAHENLLNAMGHTLTTINEPSVTQSNLTEYDLIIYTNAGWCPDASQSTFDNLRSAYESNKIPLYFMGDDVAHMVECSELTDVGDILLVNSTENNGDAPSTILISKEHSITDGVNQISYLRDIDITTVYSNEVEVLATTSLDSPVVFAYENLNGTRISTQLISLKSSNIIISDADGLSNLSQLYRNTINWLLTQNNDCEAEYQAGYEAGFAAAQDDCEGLYTEEQMNEMVMRILAWGDIDGDNKVSLAEIIHNLRQISGVK